MHQQQRVKLHFGPYRTPRFKYGKRVEDLRRGEVRIVGLSDGRIPWPIGQKGRAKALVLFRGLAHAVRRESALAIRYWWRVSPASIGNWRRALGVEPNNVGTLRLRQANGQEPWFRRAQKLAWAKADDPIRRAKIAAAKLGKPRPVSVVEALRQANTGRRHSIASRRRMSVAQRRRRTWPPAAGKPWASWEDALCRTLPIRDVVQQSGRTPAAVKSRRRVLGLPDGRRKKNRRA